MDLCVLRFVDDENWRVDLQASVVQADRTALTKRCRPQYQMQRETYAFRLGGLSAVDLNTTWWGSTQAIGSVASAHHIVVRRTKIKPRWTCARVCLLTDFLTFAAIPLRVGKVASALQEFPSQPVATTE